jgi:hypothetical protein
MAGNIFINYRRDDDAGFTQALYSRLEQAFPAESLFMDVDNIAPGLDFVQVLNDQVARCDVLIAVIGKNWLQASDEIGERRLNNPEDFVRVEIESALAQKKRVIPVLVNDATMPRSTDLPESLKGFARCNAVRLSHERFRADAQGLIRALQDVLAELDAARKAESEEAQRQAKERERAEAERLRQERREQSRKRGGTKLDERASGQQLRSGVVSWIAGLPSEISWLIPVAVVAVALLGWFLPGLIFTPQGGLGWGWLSLLYAFAGLMAVGVMFRLRRGLLSGAELAVYWYGFVSFCALIALSVVTALGLAGTINADLSIAGLAFVTSASLLAVRRGEIGGLESAVYWFGLALILFWGTISLIAAPLASSGLATYLNDNAGYRAAGIVLAGIAMVTALAILLWRNRRLSGPEATVYLIGIAYMIYVGIRLA